MKLFHTNIIIGMVASLLFACGLFVASPAVLAVGANQAEICDAIGSGTDCAQNGHGAANVDSVIKTILNIFTVVVAIVAVIMIITGGFKYITSGGDASKVTSAKNTLVYAVIGLVVVALSQFIVKFVLNKSTATSKTTVTCTAPEVLDTKTNTCVNP